jgi:Organic solute transporter Ostalpha
VIFTIPVFAVVSFLSVAFNDAAIYLKPVAGLYEAFALAGFFILLCAFVQEDDNEREFFFQSSGTTKHYLVLLPPLSVSHSALTSVKAATIGAFQFPVVMLIVLIVTCITQAAGTYCETSNKVYFAHIWVRTFYFHITHQ